MTPSTCSVSRMDCPSQHIETFVPFACSITIQLPDSVSAAPSAPGPDLGQPHAGLPMPSQKKSNTLKFVCKTLCSRGTKSLDRIKPIKQSEAGNRCTACLRQAALHLAGAAEKRVGQVALPAVGTLRSLRTNQPASNKPTNKPTNQPTNQPTTNPPTHQPTNPPAHQPINPPTHQPINPSTHQPTHSFSYGIDMCCHVGSKNMLARFAVRPRDETLPLDPHICGKGAARAADHAATA